MTAAGGETLLGALRRAAASPEGVRFLDRRCESFVSYREIFERASGVAGGLAAIGIAPGERLGVAVETGPSFYDAFFGAIAAGAAPISLPLPPRFGPRRDYGELVASTLRSAGARVLLVEEPRRFTGMEALALDSIPRSSPRAVEGDPDALALIQLSSGTTGSPRTIGLTHRQLLANVHALIDRFLTSYSPDLGYRHGGVSWLPLYHDMGLVGSVLTALVRPGPLALMKPEEFVARPARWLQAISRHRATISAAPHFAYELALERVLDEELSGVDLSCWLFALDGAEPVTASTLRRFHQRFRRFGLRLEALTPVYGLAEAALAVTFSDPTAPFSCNSFDLEALIAKGRAIPAAGGQELVSSGRPLPGIEIRIAGGRGEVLEEGGVGRVLIRGPSVSTEVAGEDGFFDTGDRGFLLEGELYLCGRTKDLVVLRGRNYPPEMIEEAIEGAAGVRRGAVAAIGFWTERGEGLCILAERDGGGKEGEDLPEVMEEIRSRVVERCGVAPDRIVLVEPRSLPRTSSGKIRRREAARLHASDRLSF